MFQRGWRADWDLEEEKEEKVRLEKGENKQVGEGGKMRGEEWERGGEMVGEEERKERRKR